jgi:hypothetical protein
MRKTAAVAKTEAPDAARLRAEIISAIMTEFIGDLATGIWLAAAQRAAERIVDLLACGGHRCQSRSSAGARLPISKIPSCDQVLCSDVPNITSEPTSIPDP